MITTLHNPNTTRLTANARGHRITMPPPVASQPVVFECIIHPSLHHEQRPLDNTSTHSQITAELYLRYHRPQNNFRPRIKPNSPPTHEHRHPRHKSWALEKEDALSSTNMRIVSYSTGIQNNNFLHSSRNTYQGNIKKYTHQNNVFFRECSVERRERTQLTINSVTVFWQTFSLSLSLSLSLSNA